jgi:hypothetical protein
MFGFIPAATVFKLFSESFEKNSLILWSAKRGDSYFILCILVWGSIINSLKCERSYWSAIVSEL